MIKAIDFGILCFAVDCLYSWRCTYSQTKEREKKSRSTLCSFISNDVYALIQWFDHHINKYALNHQLSMSITCSPCVNLQIRTDVHLFFSLSLYTLICIYLHVYVRGRIGKRFSFFIFHFTKKRFSVSLKDNIPHAHLQT